MRKIVDQIYFWTGALVLGSVVSVVVGLTAVGALEWAILKIWGD